MIGYIDNFDFLNMEAQKYWSFPSSYSTAKRQEQLNTMLYSNNYLASEKKDGYWQMVLKDEDGNIFMRARSKGVNDWICKQDWVPHLNNFFNCLPNGTCLLTEVYLPGKTSKAITTILGCGKDKAIQRQQDGNFLRMYIFDVLAFDNKDLHSTSISSRIEFLKMLDKKDPYIDIATYWTNPDDIHENWLRILSEGGEGVVLSKKDNLYEPGKRTARHTLKLKKELQETIDVFLTGKWKEATKLYTGDSIETWKYWYDEEKEKCIETTLSDCLNIDALTPVTRLWFYNMAGAVEIATVLDGKVTPIGWISGVSDEVRSGIVKNPDKWKGKVVELQAMEIDHSGSIPTLRHAKIVNWRTDAEKTWKDCIWNR